MAVYDVIKGKLIQHLNYTYVYIYIYIIFFYPFYNTKTLPNLGVGEQQN